ncbi:MAG: DUF885 family protein [Thermoanaerobaculia bacterium]
MRSIANSPRPAPLAAAALALALLVPGCAQDSKTAPPDAAARVDDLAEEAWQALLARSPFLQVTQGELVRQIHDLTPEQAAEDIAFARSVIERIEAIATEDLDHERVLTLRVLRWDAEQAIATEPYYWLNFPMTPYSAGFSISFLHQIFGQHPFEEGAGHAANYSGLVDEYADHIEQLRTHVEGQVERGIRLARPALPAVRQLFRAYRGGVRAALSVDEARLVALSEEERSGFTGRVDAAIGARIEPAYDALLAVLESPEYQDSAPETVGLSQYPDGEAYYRVLVRAHTTMGTTPEELHELGKQRVADLAAEMASIREKLGFTGTQREFHDQLRTDPRFVAETPADVEARFNDYIARIEPLVPDLFAAQPAALYGVRRLDPAAEGGMTFGYYQPPSPAEPQGLYRYNGSQLDQRSLIFAGPLIFHELVPGHHFHLALQSENESLPAYRRNYLGAGAFNEGWGNYGALLAAENGLLADPYDRYGWAIFDMFISVRLVVDTGMNLLGWSLEEGRQYMRDHTFQSETEIATESLRYSTDMYGQALNYKAGLEKLLSLRKGARARAGDDFDIRDFHSAVLGSGALPMEILEEHLDWTFEQDQAD